MTGEITLHGRVLPIGGLREKSMAAYRRGLKTVFIPWDNQKDLEEIDAVVKEHIEFVPVKRVEEILDRVLIPKKSVSVPHKPSLPEPEIGSGATIPSSVGGGTIRA